MGINLHRQKLLETKKKKTTTGNVTSFGAQILCFSLNQNTEKDGSKYVWRIKYHILLKMKQREIYVGYDIVGWSKNGNAYRHTRQSSLAQILIFHQFISTPTKHSLREVAYSLNAIQPHVSLIKLPHYLGTKHQRDTQLKQFHIFSIFIWPPKKGIFRISENYKYTSTKKKMMQTWYTERQQNGKYSVRNSNEWCKKIERKKGTVIHFRVVPFREMTMMIVMEVITWEKVGIGILRRSDEAW